jgi:hypothetical protein
MMVKNLAGYEIDTLPQYYNLPDGHAFRSRFAAEEAIIDRSAHFFKNTNRQQQNEIKRESTRGFLRLAKLSWDEDALGYVTCLTASMALFGEGLQFPQ